MKTCLLACLVVSFSQIWTVSFSQTCSQNIDAFMAAPGGYDISGTGLLEAAPEGTTLYFDSAFSTQSGPDLHVYLAINFAAPSDTTNTNIDLGSLLSNSGEQSYTVPGGVSLGDYAYVLIHCKSFNHWWGGGLLGEINCTTGTSTPDEKLSPSVYPNPARDAITISSLPNGVKNITIMDMPGHMRIIQSLSDQNEINIDISGLETGLFFLKGTDATGATLLSRRIIKM